MAADLPGQGSSGRQVALLLWSQLLLLTTVAVTWAAIRRSGPRRRGSAPSPSCSPMLWQVFENLAVLLPNTL